MCQVPRRRRAVPLGTRLLPNTCSVQALRLLQFTMTIHTGVYVRSLIICPSVRFGLSILNTAPSPAKTPTLSVWSHGVA